MNVFDAHGDARLPRKLTVERKILLHLFNYQSMEMEFEVPAAVVQDGIAAAVNIRRDNIPRTIKKLKEEDLIYDVLKRIKGMPRKRKAYFLTEIGERSVEEILGSFRSSMIFLQLGDGGVRQIYLEEVADYLKVNISLLEIFNLLDDDGRLREKGVRSYLSGRSDISMGYQRGNFVSFLQDVPIPKRFCGREEELGMIDRWVRGEGSSVMSVTGIAGIGKTTLAAKAATDLEDRAHIFWYRFHRWDSVRNVLYSISRFLEEMGRSGFRSYLDNTQRLDMKDLYPILEGNLMEGPILMVFDDFQRAADDIVELFVLLKDMLPATSGIKIMVVGRQVFPFYDRSDVVVKGVVQELSLEGLDEESCRSLLKVKDLDDELFSKVYSITKGHPLFVQLVTTGQELRDQKDIKRYIYEEIFKKLEEKESLFLQIASVFRYPVPSAAFFMEEALDFTLLDRLVEKNLLQEISYDEYEAHDLIKEFFYNRLTPKQKTGYHMRASEHYMEVGTNRSTVEAMYHLTMGGEPVKALKLAATYGDLVISKGYTEQFASVLDLLNREVSEKRNDYLAMTRLLTGRVQMIMGHWDRALSELKRASAIAEAENRPDIGVMANLNIGVIESRRGNRDGAEKRLKRGLKMARKLSDREKISSALQAIGELYSISGEFDQAKKYMSESLEIATDLELPSLQAASFTGLGIIYTNQDQHKKAIDQFERAIAALEVTEDLLMLSRVKISLGTVLATVGDHDEAVTNFEDSIEICSGTGDIRQLGYSMAGAAHVYLMKRDLETAREYLDEALSIFDQLGEKVKLASIRVDYGRMFIYGGDLEKGKREFERSLELIDEIGSSYHRKRIAREIREFLRSCGHHKEAARYR